MAKTKIKIMDSEQGYNLAAPDYDKKETYLNSFEQHKLLPLLGDVREKNILDVGAGTGRLALLLCERGALLTALDVSEEMLKILQKKSGNRSNIKCVVGDAENMELPDESFDIVVAAFLIVHLKNPLFFFKEAYRVLKPGGLFVVTNINQKEPPEIKTREGSIKIDSFYHRRDKIREQLEEVAFGIEKEVVVQEGEQWINQIFLAKK
jgi:ubiquinone/menaquinone biosynthesis C-methylase UbiE